MANKQTDSFELPRLSNTAGVTPNVTFRKDHVLLIQGAPADTLYYLQEGTVKVSVLSEQGKEAVIAVLGAGSFFGEGCLAGQKVHMASAIALTDCLVTRLERSAVVRMLHEETVFRSFHRIFA